MNVNPIKAFKQWRIRRYWKLLDKHDHEWIQDFISLQYVCNYPGCPDTMSLENYERAGKPNDYWT